MASLLTLPTEIRSRILLHALNARRDPPSQPTKDHRTLYDDIPYTSWRVYVYQEDRETHTRPNSTALKINHTLDISMLNEVDLYPTWTCIPHLTTKISTLHATVRLFGHIITLNNAANQTGDGGHLGFHWSFYALLERFLAYGAVPEKIDTDGRYAHNSHIGSHRHRANPLFPRRDIHIDELILDIRDAEKNMWFPDDEVTYRDWRRQHHNGWYWHDESAMPEALSAYKPRPEWIAIHLCREIMLLLSDDYHYGPYGDILRRCVGRIRVVMGRKVVRAFGVRGLWRGGLGWGMGVGGRLSGLRVGGGDGGSVLGLAERIMRRIPGTLAMLMLA
ncbi:hypothetical protein BDW74DRAFT_183969 [Aspergillus multicolor]|uniref:uncharacterized protein n=1 Tax=Aspergillus multicolor TaxID=41759 RepID=UPI003CCD28E7